MKLEHAIVLSTSTCILGYDKMIFRDVNEVMFRVQGSENDAQREPDVTRLFRLQTPFFEVLIQVLAYS